MYATICANKIIELLTFTCSTVNSGGSDDLWFSLFYWCVISSVYQDVYKL
jgi:hypothetical protein